MDACKVQCTAVARACLSCCERFHKTTYQRGVKYYGAWYVVPNDKWKINMTNTTSHLQTNSMANSRVKPAVMAMTKHMPGRMEEAMWGIELKRGVRTHLQDLLLEKGADWISQLGGAWPPYGIHYSCKNPKCRAIPMQHQQWARFAALLMSDMRPQLEAWAQDLQET